MYFFHQQKYTSQFMHRINHSLGNYTYKLEMETWTGIWLKSKSIFVWISQTVTDNTELILSFCLGRESKHTTWLWGLTRDKDNIWPVTESPSWQGPFLASSAECMGRPAPWSSSHGLSSESGYGGQVFWQCGQTGQESTHCHYRSHLGN